MNEQEYLHQGQEIAKAIECAEKDLAEAQDTLDDLRGKQVDLQKTWKEKGRKFAELPYKSGDIVHFDKATLAANRTRDYKVTKTDRGHLWLETEGHDYRFTHEEAEQTGITVVKKAGS